jgi:response regulator of citrate/malate metabolism
MAIVIQPNPITPDERMGLQLGALDYLIKTQTTPARLSSGLETWLKE